MPSHVSPAGDRREGGWLIQSFTCCAPGGLKDDDSVDRLMSSEQRNREPIYDQPQRVTPPNYHGRPSTSHGGATQISQWIASGRASLSGRRPWSSHSKGRPKIGAPTDFRHLNDMPRRRHSFSPLQLSIYLPGGNLSPLPDFEVEEWDMTTALKKPEPALVNDSIRPQTLTHGYSDSVISGSFTIPRKPLSVSHGDVGSHHRFGSYASASTSILYEGFIPGSDLPLQDLPPDAASNIIQSLPAVRHSDSRHSRPRTSTSSTPSRLRSTSPAKSRSRSNTGSSSTRKPSFRRTKTDVDEAIQELNTIIEEKRLDAVRAAASRNQSPRVSERLNSPAMMKDEQSGEISPGLPSPHVPAIVPKMKVHARSETLSDIGSAFSTPLLGNKPLPTPPSLPMSVSEESLKPGRPKLSLFPVTTSRSVTALSPVSPPTAVSARTKISTWLRKSLTASLISPTESTGPDYITESYNSHHKNERENATSPFYKCHQPALQGGYDDAPSTSTLSSYAPSPLQQSPSDHSSFSVTDTFTATAPTSAASPSPLGHDRRPSATKLPFAAHVKERGSSKAAHVARARGLSVGTVSGVPPPPAYEEVDPHPNTPASTSESRVVGLAF
ncbi:hypothetical protein NA57DRAFT_73144 [Rhizodiscina lignyota]|uniref:Uncharacterized protein n=1 Tax=Rhizodiscina lignyota TaxID=1504668 RepID=A0A9P4IHC3_9PEZI|nr:hypothetical protein NA57DRAFT_73144 [Rhizodiscina lignyota]